MKNLHDTFPNQFREVRKNNRFRPLLKYRKTGLLISLIFARNSTNHCEKSWIIDTPKEKREHTTLLVLLDVHGGGVESLWLFRTVPTDYRHMRVRVGDDFLQTGTRLDSMSHLVEAIRTVRTKDNLSLRRPHLSGLFKQRQGDF